MEMSSFRIECLENGIININITYIISVDMNNFTFLEYMQKFIERSIYSKENWEFTSDIEKNWRFIYAKSENIIQIQENILYPSKNLVTFFVKCG